MQSTVARNGAYFPGRILFMQFMRIKSGILFLLLCGIPFLLLAGAEVTLRAIGYGQDYALFIPCPDKESGTYTVNSHFYARNFYTELKKNIEETARWGTVLQKKKKEDVFRIFMFGGSVAMGEDPDKAFNIPRFLEVMLQEAFPEVHFEICNLACFALGSAVMSDAAEQASCFSPDLYLIYMGNNEYLGTMLSQWHRNGMPHKAWLVRCYYRAQQYRLVQLVQSFFPEKESPAPKDWDDFYTNAFKLKAGTAGRERMYRNYEKNLQDMCRSARRGGADVLLSTVGTNIAALPPMGSAHREGLAEEERVRWEQYFAAGCALLPQEPQQALDQFQKAMEIDPDPAKLHFHMGEAFAALNRLAEAKSAFQEACDRDIYPVRADSHINAAIRQKAQEKDGATVWLADVEAAFAAASPIGIAGQEFCYDFVHQCVEGNYRIASVMFDAVADAVALRTGQMRQKEKLDYEHCCRSLGMSPLLYVRCVNAILDDQEHLRELFPDYLPGRFTQLKKEAEAALPESAVDDALEAIDSALEIRGEDLQLRRLRCEILRDAGRAKEMHQEAQKILVHFGDTPLGAFTARSFILADGQ
mgnify:FL=1|jgi:tetratricopeptide (TPR) repeat protein